MQSKNAKRKDRRYRQALPESRYTVQSSWPDMIQGSKRIAYAMQDRTTKARHGTGAR